MKNLNELINAYFWENLEKDVFSAFINVSINGQIPYEFYEIPFIANHFLRHSSNPDKYKNIGSENEIYSFDKMVDFITNNLDLISKKIDDTCILTLNFPIKTYK